MGYTTAGLMVLTCAILSAKWASDLGFRQSRQVLWGIAGLALGPLALLLLLCQVLEQVPDKRFAGRQMVRAFEPWRASSASADEYWNTPTSFSGVFP